MSETFWIRPRPPRRPAGSPTRYRVLSERYTRYAEGDGPMCDSDGCSNSVAGGGVEARLVETPVG